MDDSEGQKATTYSKAPTSMYSSKPFLSQSIHSAVQYRFTKMFFMWVAELAKAQVLWEFMHICVGSSLAPDRRIITAI